MNSDLDLLKGRWVLLPRQKLAIAMLILAGVRLLTLGAYPLFDLTEARYAEIARLMAETGDWIVPHIDYGVPFWAKPPLSTWLSAASVFLLGANEFAVRLPSFFLGIAVVFLTFFAQKDDRDAAIASAAILGSSVLFFISAGAVMTDMALLFCTTLAMLSFFRAVEQNDKSWNYWFFVALGLGMLAKGPIAIVLSALPIFAWTLWFNRWGDIWQRLPWFSGSILAAIISLPWYAIAEIHSPGFLNYFILTEHFHRFSASGDIEDLYGHQHIQFYGIIWLYGFVATLPWSGMLLALAVKNFSQLQSLIREFLHTPSRVYFLCWTLAAGIFFTFTRNLLWTYILPGLPAFSVLAAQAFCSQSGGMQKHIRGFLIGTLIPPFAMIGFVVAAALGVVAPPSGKILLSQASRLPGWHPGALAYVKTRPYSAQFYEKGRARKVSLSELTSSMSRDIQFLAVPRSVRLQDTSLAQLTPVGGDRNYQLFRVNSDSR